MRDIFDFLCDKESLWRLVHAFVLICYGRVKIRVATDAVRVMILFMNASVCLQLELTFSAVSIFIF